MKSDLKSYRVYCIDCETVKRVAFALMDRKVLVIYCQVCRKHTEHKKKD